MPILQKLCSNDKQKYPGWVTHEQILQRMKMGSGDQACKENY